MALFPFTAILEQFACAKLCVHFRARNNPWPILGRIQDDAILQNVDWILATDDDGIWASTPKNVLLSVLVKACSQEYKQNLPAVRKRSKDANKTKRATNRLQGVPRVG